MDFTRLILLLVSMLAWFSPHSYGADQYTDQNRPYEFGFSIDGEQHRHEKKDKNGIIMGEFGFITADDVYHVTVYATDEQGRFKILSMKNIHLKGKKSVTSARQGHSLQIPTTHQVVTTTQPPKNSSQDFKPISLEPPVNSCSHCSLPTTSTEAPKPLAPSISQTSTKDNNNLVEIGSPLSNSQYPQQIQNPSTYNKPGNYYSPLQKTDPQAGPFNQNIFPSANQPNKNQDFGLEQNNIPGRDSEQSYPQNLGSSQNNQDINGQFHNYPSNTGTQSYPSVNQNYPQVTENQQSYIPQRPNDEQINRLPLFGNAGQSHTQTFGSQQNYQPNEAYQESSHPQEGPGFLQPNVEQSNNLYSPQSNRQQTGISNIGSNLAPYPGSESPKYNNQKNLGEGIDGTRPSGEPMQRHNIQGSRTAKQFTGENNLTPLAQGQKPTLAYAQMQIVDKNTDIHAKAPGEKEGLPQGLTENDMVRLLYTFNYTLSFQGHFEEGYSNGVKQGYYFVTGRNGVRTRVDYVADDKGFHPKISQDVLDLLSDDVPKPETEKQEKYGLKGYEFKWLYYPVDSNSR